MKSFLKIKLVLFIYKKSILLKKILKIYQYLKFLDKKIKKDFM